MHLGQIADGRCSALLYELKVSAAPGLSGYHTRSCRCLGAVGGLLGFLFHSCWVGIGIWKQPRSCSNGP